MERKEEALSEIESLRWRTEAAARAAIPIPPSHKSPYLSTLQPGAKILFEKAGSPGGTGLRSPGGTGSGRKRMGSGFHAKSAEGELQA